MYWFNRISLLILVTGSTIGCAQRGAYLGRGARMMPAVHRSTGRLVNAGACHGCGEIADCRCRVFPGAKLLRCLTCGAGCGDVYWGEWTSDPPEVCEGCPSHASPPLSLSAGHSTLHGSAEFEGEATVVRTSHSHQPQPLWKTHSLSGRH